MLVYWQILTALPCHVLTSPYLCQPVRMEGDAYVHFKAMLISLAVHLVLLMFELLVCDKLQSGRHMWILVFVPLIFISILSIVVCVWAVKHDRSCEVSRGGGGGFGRGFDRASRGLTGGFTGSAGIGPGVNQSGFDRENLAEAGDGTVRWVCLKG